MHLGVELRLSGTIRRNVINRRINGLTSLWERRSFRTIRAPIGAGGIAEVYRAKETNLGRDVALKVLPEVFVPRRRAHFGLEREAQVLASLSYRHDPWIRREQRCSGPKAMLGSSVSD